MRYAMSITAWGASLPGGYLSLGEASANPLEITPIERNMRLGAARSAQIRTHDRRWRLCRRPARRSVRTMRYPPPHARRGVQRRRGAAFQDQFGGNLPVPQGGRGARLGYWGIAGGAVSWPLVGQQRDRCLRERVVPPDVGRARRHRDKDSGDVFLDVLSRLFAQVSIELKRPVFGLTTSNTGGPPRTLMRDSPSRIQRFPSASALTSKGWPGRAGRSRPVK